MLEVTHNLLRGIKQAIFLIELSLVFAHGWLKLFFGVNFFQNNLIRM